MSIAEPGNRYSVIEKKNPREILLLRGRGCGWRRCSFCDYHLDFSKNEEENYRLNKKELEKISGCYGKLEVINSGSFPELDERTIEDIRTVCGKKTSGNFILKCTGCIRIRFGKYGIILNKKESWLR